MVQDRQRRRVYDAEHRVCDQLDFAARGASAVTVLGSTLTLAADTRFGSLETAQAWVDHLRGRSWFAARWPHAAASPLALRARRGQGGAHYEASGAGGTVAVPVPGNATGWAMREMVLLHEAAHHVVACDLTAVPPTEPPPPHGGQFAAVMLELVEGVLGSEARLLLTAAYRDGGVEVATPRAVAPAGAAPARSRPGAARARKPGALAPPSRPGVLAPSQPGGSP